MHASELRSHDRELTRQVFGCCSPSIETVEAVYWKSVESGAPQLTVHYAADLRTNELGSGFPVPPEGTPTGDASLDGSTANCARSSSNASSSSSASSGSSSTEASVGGSPQQRQCHAPAPQAHDGMTKTEPHLQPQQQQQLEQDYDYATHPWNLARLARVEGSLLRHYHRDVPGVTSPWLYVGTVFSSFCWHTEDNFFAACNYHHWGAPKVLLLARFLLFLVVCYCHLPLSPLYAACRCWVLVGCCLFLSGADWRLCSELVVLVIVWCLFATICFSWLPILVAVCCSSLFVVSC